MCFFSTDGVILSWNFAFQSLLGYSNGDLHTRVSAIKEVISPGDWAQIGLSYFCCIKERKKSFKAKLRGKHTNGCVIEMNCHNDILQNDDKKPMMCLCVVLDWTVREPQMDSNQEYAESNVPTILEDVLL